MQALILAGGAGTRLGDLTLSSPKPMLEVNGKPFLLYIIELLKKNQIKKIVLAIGYLADQFIDYFGNGEKFGVEITYSIEKDFAGTGGAVGLAKDLLEDKFFIVNGDTYLDIDYPEVYCQFCTSSSLGMVVVYDNVENITLSNIAVGENNFIVAYEKKEKIKKGVLEIKKQEASKTVAHNLKFIDAGVQVFDKSILNYIPGHGFSALENEVYPKLIKEKQLKAYITKQRYYDMGTPERLKQVKEVLK